MSNAASTEIFIAANEVEKTDKTLLGFWIYLMTDCVLFASLFATYAVLHGNTNGGPAARDIFHLPYVLAETLLLLTSSFTCGLSMLAMRTRSKKWLMIGLACTLLLGLGFLTLELTEFHHLATEGSGWRRSGFLSAYFTLVGTHGLHITIGLLWLLFGAFQAWRRGITAVVARRLTMFSLFWHFLDLIWIFIFTVVYLFGAVQ